MWNELFVYAAKSAFVLTLLYAPYTLLLRKEHFFRQNRLTLVGILVLSLILPFINLLHGEIGFVAPQPEPVVTFVESQAVVTAEPTSVSEATPQTPQPVAVSQPSRQPIDYTQWLCILYIIGVSVAIGIRLWQFIRMDRLIRRGCLWHDTVDGITIYCHASDIAPYSWMRRIVISQHDYDNHRHEILLHERGHVLCHHSWDILLLMLVQTVQWFNPFVYMFGASLRDVHEYEADDYVLRQGVSAGQYQTLLLKTAVGASAYSFANNFNHSKIKSRIVMMKHKKINPWMRCKVLYILPVAFAALIVYAQPEIIEPIIPDSVQNVDEEFHKILDEMLLLYDGEVVDTDSFLELLRTDYDSDDVLRAVPRKKLEKHVHKLAVPNIGWLLVDGDEEIQMRLYYDRTHNEKAKNGVLEVDKDGPDRLMEVDGHLEPYPFHRVESLDEVLLVYDGKVVNEEEFVRLIKEDWGPYDVAYVVNKYLEPHVKKLYLHTLRFYKDHEDPKIAEQLLHRYINSKALSGAVVIVKNNATNILGFDEKEQSYDPYNAVSPYNFLLVGTVPKESDVTIFMVSLADKYGNINKENAHRIPVKDGKFVYQTYLEQPTKALIWAANAPASAAVEQVFVPNNTLNLLFTGNRYKSKSVPMTFSERSVQTPKREEQPKEAAVQVGQGKQKEKKLFGRGTRVPGTSMQYTPNQIGQEIGTALTIARPTEIREFSFDVLSCNIKDAVMGINIYRADTDTKFIGPILANVEQGKKQTIGLRPVEFFVLEPGEYIVSIGLVDCDEETKALWANSHQWDEEQRREMAKQSSLQLPFYVKESYIRRDASDTFEKRNINVGLQVKGIEY
ncbi:MAG: M56 family metallopeptidase [Bacteroidaceae bacterium]|nr:M56 family metallopeptidase [Bacteroidaceae bacterium]